MTQPRTANLGDALARHYAQQNAAREQAQAERNDTARDARNDYWADLAARIVELPHGDKIYFGLTADQRAMVDAHLEAMEDAA